MSRLRTGHDRGSNPTGHTLRPGLTATGMVPRLTKADLFRPYRYQDKERRAALMKQQEQQLLTAVTRRADKLGLEWYHPNDPRRDRPGFPDLTIAGPQGFVMWELKSTTGRRSLAQMEWGRLLGNVPYLGHMVLRPSGWDKETLAWLLLDQIAGL